MTVDDEIADEYVVVSSVNDSQSPKAESPLASITDPQTSNVGITVTSSELTPNTSTQSKSNPCTFFTKGKLGAVAGITCAAVALGLTFG